MRRVRLLVLLFLGPLCHVALPGRGKLPILGDTLELLNPKKMVSYQLEGREKWGPVWKTSVLFKKAVMICGLDELGLARKHESRAGNTKAFFPPHQKRLFGEHSLLVQSGEAHDRLRKLVQMAMTPRAVEMYTASIDLAIDDFLKACRQEQGYFPMVTRLQKTMVTIVVQVLFGQKFAAEELQALIRDLRIWAQGLLSAPMNVIPWSNAARAMRARGRVEKVLRRWMVGAEEGTLLHELLNARDEEGNALSSEEVVDNTFTLVFAGLDTTASLLSSSFLRLSQDPELQKQLRNGEGSLDAFLAETLRLNAPAPFAMRLLVTPLQLGEVSVPGGWLIVYGIGASQFEARM